MNLKSQIAALANEFVREGDCELFDTYDAHENSFIAGANFAATLVMERLGVVSETIDYFVDQFGGDCYCDSSHTCNACTAEKAFNALREIKREIEG